MEEQRQDSWIEVLSHVVAGLRSTETISELAAQAREALAELRVQAGRRSDEAHEPADGQECEQRDEDGAAESRLGGDPGALAARLDALGASVGELTDLLDAGLERLETVEMQLGDPDENVDAQVAGAVERCQSRLAAIEHRLGAVASMLRDAHTAAAPGWSDGDMARQQRAGGPLTVLVVDHDSARRCATCVALEHQGLRCIAVADSGGAAVRLGTARPDAVLIDVDSSPDEVAALAAVLAESDPATAPAAPVMVVTAQRSGRIRATQLRETFGNWPLLCSAEGDAALAAAVTERAQRHSARAGAEIDATQETTPHAFDAESQVRPRVESQVESQVESDGAYDPSCAAASE